MTETKGLREKEEKELRKILKDTREELAHLSGQRAEGSLKDSSTLGRKRREVAQVLTVLGEKRVLSEIESAKKNENVEEKA